MPAAIPFWKRPLDVFLVVIFLPIFLPVALVIVLGILIVSPGSVFYHQERVGYRGRRFKCWKFRSMKIGAADLECVHEQHSTDLMHTSQPWRKMDKEDPRVIPLGRLLRASGLDELPQLFNILRGDMSVVGPRPCTPYEYDRYLPWQMERFECLPGLTGLWQVSGKNRTTFVEMVLLDIHYVRRSSVPMDLRIILNTLPALLEEIYGLSAKPSAVVKPQPTLTGNCRVNGDVNRDVNRNVNRNVNRELNNR